jgi:HD-like signal output (HDOD) protein
LQELIASFNDETVDTKIIARHISADQVMTAKLLQLANSPYYQVPRTVATVSDAVNMLGFFSLRTLVMSIGLKGSFKPVLGLNSRQFWRNSVYTAVAARHLARPLGLDVELAFTLGLMRGIGQLMMHLAMPTAMLELDERISLFDPDRLAVEKETLGYNHLDVSAELVRRWNFPAVFYSVISASANPLSQDNFDPIAATIYIAAWRSYSEENHLTVNEMEEAWPAEVATRINISKAQLVHDFPSWESLSEGMQVLLS